MSGGFWSAHTHSQYSVIDALPTVEKVVSRAAELGYQALGLTDHGNMGGAAKLYTECRRAGIKPLPGVEAYVQIRRDKGNRKNMHMGMLATSAAGYRNLVALTTKAHRNFYFKPVLDFADIAQAASDGKLEGIAALSGCWFGVLPTLLREGDHKAVRNLMTSLDAWFGSGLFIELQHHAVNHDGQDDRENVALVHGIARSLGLPVVITQDSHYCYQADKEQHETLKRLTTWNKEDPDNAIFPGDGYHMVGIDWMKDRYTTSQLSDGLEGLDHLAAIADVVIPELDTYRMAIPDTGGNPDDILRSEADAALLALLGSGRVKASRSSAYQERIEEELDVIRESGFAGYLLLTKAVCDFMREKSILYAARGSASGSLLCWLLGITSLDSLEWSLPFDRFLSRDRTKPPDIDLDIEHRRRDEVIEWISERHHTVRIGTWGEMKMHNEDDEDRGALVVKWQAMNARLGGEPKSKPDGPELRKLQELASHRPLGNYGVHAAGLMVTPDEATAACVPLMYAASSQTMVTAFDMGDIERLGLVKLDLLNGKTMTALRVAFDLTGMSMDKIPLNDKDTFRLIQSRSLTGLFQLEGRSFASGIRQMRPRRFTDLIAAMALFRPATMKSGATEMYLTRRKGNEPIPTRHPVIMEETKDTYGVIVYQEQVLNIMKRIGLTVDEIEKVRKAIKASNDNVDAARQALAGLQSRIAEKATSTGMSESDISWLNDAVTAYADYGFNKAHSTSYAIMAYATAYMRCHYPLEFWAGMLDAYVDSTSKTWYMVSGKRALLKQSDAYQREASEDGVKIFPVHVNKSKKSWTIDKDYRALRKGLETVQGVGPSACAELERHQPFTDLDDLASRVSGFRVSGATSLGKGHSPKSCGGVIAALHEVGALSGLEHDPAMSAWRVEQERLKAEEKEQRAARQAHDELRRDIRIALDEHLKVAGIAMKKNTAYWSLVTELADRGHAEGIASHVDNWIKERT